MSQYKPVAQDKRRWGGLRRGLRRPEDRRQLSLTLRESLVKRVDVYADMIHWTRSAVIELVLEKKLSAVMDNALEVIGRDV